MSRNVSAALRSAVYAQESSEVLLTLLDIVHADLAATLRLVNNTVAVVHGGNTYQPYFFKLTLPQDDNGNIKNVSLVADNVDRQLVYALRSISSPALVTVTLVLASAPDTIELKLSDTKLRNVSYTADVITGELVFEEKLAYQVPGYTFTPSLFPGIF